MRKQFKLSIYLLSVAGALGVAPYLMAVDAISQTFFSVRPQYQSMSPELVSHFRGERSHARQDGIGGALQFAFFGGKSTSGDCSEDSKLGKYFMPFGKSTLVVGEPNSDAANDGTIDVLASYFGVLTSTMNFADFAYNAFSNLTFQSTISFAPVQTVFGLGLSYRQSFAQEDDNKGWFVSASAPIMRVKNDLGFEETIINAGAGATPDGFAATMQSALQGDPVLNWGAMTTTGSFAYPGIEGDGLKRFEYGKIATPNSTNSSSSDSCNSNCSVRTDCNGALTKWGLADIELKIGYESVREEKCYSEGYIGAVIPTGNKPTGEFIFEPIVGNNKHFGVMIGGSCGFEVWHSDENASCVWFECDADGRYLFANTQKRSFDLMDKQWSRYMWVYPNSSATPIADIQPGINFFTKDMRVTPRGAVDCNTALVYKGEVYNMEVGYNFFARCAEKVELCPGWQVGPGIAGFNQVNVLNDDARINSADVGKVGTASNATISKFNGVALIDTEDTTALINGTHRVIFNAIKESDINLRSAAHPAVITNTFYGSAGARWDDKEYPPFVGVGGSYEFSWDNTGLNRWLVWGKFGFSF